MINQITEVIEGLTPLQITLNLVALAVLVFWISRGIYKKAVKKKLKLNKDLDPANCVYIPPQKGHYENAPRSVRVSEPLRDDYSD
jgi:hypothetical protein